MTSTLGKSNCGRVERLVKMLSFASCRSALDYLQNELSVDIQVLTFCFFFLIFGGTTLDWHHAKKLH